VAHSKKTWAKVRSAYRRGEGSYREIGEKFGVPEQTIRKRAAREKWGEQRNKVGAKAEQKAAERDVESLAAMLSKHRRLASLALDLAGLKLEAAAELAAKSVGGDAVSADGLDVVTKVVARMVPVERLAAGIERIKPVKPVEMANDDEIVFEIDAPTDAEEAEPVLPPAAQVPALPAAKAPVKAKA
jgi:transposase